MTREEAYEKLALLHKKAEEAIKEAAELAHAEGIEYGYKLRELESHAASAAWRMSQAHLAGTDGLCWDSSDCEWDSSQDY